MAHQPPPNPAAIQAALNAHDRVRKATDLPLFFGVKGKDTITPRLLIDRVNKAATIADWNEARKIDNFYMILRERAIVWWQQLEIEGIDIASWDAVSADFLASYEPRFTAKTTCTSFQDLVQRQGEAAHDYYLRVCESFNKMCEAKPATMNDVRAAAGAAVGDVKKEGILDCEKFFRHQLFLAGLKDDLRQKVMEAGKDTLRESMRLALELEVIHQDRRGRGAVAAVTMEDAVAGDEKREEDEGPFDDEEIAAINAIRLRNGKPPFKSGFRKNGNRSTVICRFCKKPGHVQKDCRARKRVNGAMVDEKGKPYERRNGVSAVEATNTAAAAEGENKTVGSIVSSALNALNW